MTAGDSSPTPGRDGRDARSADDAPSEGLGPFSRAIVATLWKRLFADEPDNPVYLPRIIKDGYPAWGLPSYDPATPGGVSDPIPVLNVPQDVADSACITTLPVPPIATGYPMLQLQNTKFTNLSAMRSVDLSFSATEPQFTAIVLVGSSDRPFTLATNDSAQPNYGFQVGCCEPVSPTSRDCSDDPPPWTARAWGNFTATAHDAELSATIRLNVPQTGPMTVTMVRIDVAVDAGNVAVDFDVRNLPEWAQQMAQIAVNEGVGNNALVDGLQTFLNSRDVLEHLETLINNELERILAETDAGDA